ncbi:MAG: MBL fold metallo-hydrolase [Candidatus Spechtbacterales bacterium]|nr:MBL fold metallo-hydrolase [Candidatus Spechtbacterales bacterium]
MAKITFEGAARSVTGSNYLIETENSKVLVDCGMYQGFRDAEEENFEKFSYDPSKLDAVLITHAHIDHTGRVPKLMKRGFSGKVYATEPTAGLMEIMLKDSQGLLEQEAERHDDHEPLYSSKDVEHALRLFEPISYSKEIQVTEDIKARFRDAGHILGSAIIEVWVTEDEKETKFVFSGDLGNSPTPLLRDRENIEEADYVLVETTYGNRTHEDVAVRKKILKKSIEEVIDSGGTLMMPIFAIERTQEILYELNSLVENKIIPEIPIFLDSPLAIDATKIYRKWTKYFNKRANKVIASGDKLFQFPRLKFTYTTQESKAINDVPTPKVILAGSGMSTGGRIMHHERRYLSDPNNMLLIIGYQAMGTLGRRLFDGVKEVKIFGERVPVRAKVRAIGGYSAHADEAALYDWVNYIHKSGRLKKVFCTHGEEEAATAFALKVQDEMGVEAYAPEPGEVFEF